MKPMPASNPIAAWKSLKEGNQRFVSGEVLHPSQGIEDRARLESAQHPSAILFGCADSRVAAEIIFDQGLGDMFVVRTAGHVVDSAVLGSIEYGVAVLAAPLIVVLGHDHCGAVKATVDALESGDVPGGYIRDVVERVTPSVLSARRDGYQAVDEFEARHVEETGNLLMQRSRIVAEKVEAGELAIVGLTYQLSKGHAQLREVIGDIGEMPA
jgi:carbonic anhydrase